MKADFPAVARPWQWGGSRDGLGMADPSLSRGQLCHTKGDGCVSAEMCGQPQPPRAGIRPRVQREVGTHGGSRGCWGKKRKGGGKLAGSCPSPSPEAAPCLLLAVRDAHPACLGCPALQRSPGSFQGWERKQFEYIGRTWASLGGGRPWQCCMRGSQEALHPQDALSLCREQEEDNPSVVRLEEHALRFTLQTSLSLAPKLKPAPGQEDGITKETSVQHWVRSSSPKEKKLLKDLKLQAGISGTWSPCGQIS